MNVYDISNKLNLRSSDYVANMVINQDLLAGLVGSCKGLAAIDSEKELSRARKNPALKNVKFIDCFRSQPDENAYDKIVCLYDEDFFRTDSTSPIQMMYRAADRNGSFLILGVPHGNKKRSIIDTYVEWVCRKNLTADDYWVFENTDNKETFDLLFKVKKDGV